MAGLTEKKLICHDDYLENIYLFTIFTSPKINRSREQIAIIDA